jgi:AbrB family transcriptional regulator (stage V sporulation protein T)
MHIISCLTNNSKKTEKNENKAITYRRRLSDMKATGIVRRIDDLGRIVIPKEIRRTLRIREADPLEIYTDREGEIILKKYSPIGEMGTFAKQYAESMAQVSGHIALITDRDQFIAVSGGMKNLLGKSISRELEEKIDHRESVVATKGDRNFIQVSLEGDDFSHEAISPIICEGDVIGSVILVEMDHKSKMGEVEQKLIQSAAGFLGRQMEQ